MIPNPKVLDLAKIHFSFSNLQLFFLKFMFSAWEDLGAWFLSSWGEQNFFIFSVMILQSTCNGIRKTLWFWSQNQSRHTDYNIKTFCFFIFFYVQSRLAWLEKAVVVSWAPYFDQEIRCRHTVLKNRALGIRNWHAVEFSLAVQPVQTKVGIGKYWMKGGSPQNSATWLVSKIH